MKHAFKRAYEQTHDAKPYSVKTYKNSSKKEALLMNCSLCSCIGFHQRKITHSNGNLSNVKKVSKIDRITCRTELTLAVDTAKLIYFRVLFIMSGKENKGGPSN